MNSKIGSMRSMLPRVWQPREIAIKRGSLMNLRLLTGNSSVVLSGATSLDASGGATQIESNLMSAGIEVAWIRGISGDPTVSGVRETAAQISAIEPDWVVACGGGSVIDHAKLAWALSERPGLELTDYSVPYTFPAIRSKSRFVAIPTTSGSGSEASVAAVVTDGMPPRKIPIVSMDFIPDVVILDPSLTIDLPNDITFYTAIDAFTHAIESYCSTVHNQITDQYAVMAGKLIVDSLQTVIRNPGDLDARERLQFAATLAGIAQNTTSVGAAHALSHALGVTTDLPHGLGNAIVLSKVLRLNAKDSTRPGMFTQEIGLDSLENIETWLASMAELVDVPLRWGESLGPDREPSAESIAAIAFDDVCLRTNPRKTSLEELSTIVESTR